MSRYLIKLKPLGPFFFGGERSFRSKDEKNEKNYFVKSNQFPQQTALLGMLRKEVLIQSQEFTYKNDIKKYNAQEKCNMKKLIGQKSFSIKENNKQIYGKIKTVSPIFLMNNKDILIQAPMDHNNHNEQYLPFNKKEEEGKSSFGKLISLEEYDPKKGVCDDFINISTMKIISNEKNYRDNTNYIFEKIEKIGITKGERGKTQEEGFYKQTLYQLHRGYTFAFIVDIDMDIKDTIVSLGGTQSMFKLIVKHEKKTFKERLSHINKDPSKLILVSDTYLGENPYEFCDFAIVDTVDFRNLELKNGEYKIKWLEEKYTFLKKGSVLYSNNIGALKRKIDSYSNLKNIGYNHYV